MRQFLLIALACLVAVGCKKYRDDSSDAPAGGGGGGGGAGFGPVQAVRGAVDRTVTAAELHDLHLFMTNAKLSLGHVPTSQETWQSISGPGGNPKLTELIKSGKLILVPNPQEEGLWAYDKDAPTMGGWVLTHSEPRRVTAQEFAQLSQQQN